MAGSVLTKVTGEWVILRNCDPALTTRNNKQLNGLLTSRRIYREVSQVTITFKAFERSRYLYNQSDRLNECVPRWLHGSVSNAHRLSREHEAILHQKCKMNTF